MNILFIAGSFNPVSGGVERVTNIIGRSLEASGNNVFLLCTGKDGDCTGAFKDVIFMDKRQGESFDNNSAELYHQILKDNHVDVIVNQYPIAERNDFFLKNVSGGIKKISFYHGSPLTAAKAGLKTSLRNGNLREVLYFLKRIYTDCKRFCQLAELSNSIGFLCEPFINQAFFNRKRYIEKCFTMPNPNTIELSDDEKKYAHIRECSKTIIFAGRIYDPGKNLIDFVRVWEILFRRHKDWRAIIVGDDSNCKMQKEYIRFNHIENISFIGKTSNIKSVFLKADIQCITSHSEGWPLVLAEGMVCGVVPVVFNTFATAREIITDGQNGYLVEKYNIQAMADKVSGLIDSTELLRNMRLSAMERVTEFSSHAVAERWAQILKKQTCSIP